MDREIRIKMVKAMEFIARQLNDEYIYESWAVFGVGEDEIEYADLSCDEEAGSEDFKYYIKDKEFSDLMELFVHLMARAKKSGGLYCDGICSDREYPDEES